jgi:predicted nucleotidyltransferase
MRLRQDEVTIILREVEKIFDDATVYLFGSRLDENRRGGDIDLFIVPVTSTKNIERKVRLAARLERLLYKPVDVVLHRDFNREIEQAALRGIELTA